MLIWLHMRKRSFSKNSWNVFRWYMFNDSKKLATKKTQQQLALLHIKWQERRSKGGSGWGRGAYKQTKKIFTTTCFYLAVAAPAGLPGKAITWPLTLGGRHRVFFFFSSFFFRKTYSFSSIQIIHTILSCQIKKIYGGSMLGFFFFSLQKKKKRTGYIETLKEYRQKQLKIQAPT